MHKQLPSRFFPFKELLGSILDGFGLIFQVYKEFFPDIAVGYEDPRVSLHITDGIDVVVLILFYHEISSLSEVPFIYNSQPLFFCRNCIFRV